MYTHTYSLIHLFYKHLHVHTHILTHTPFPQTLTCTHNNSTLSHSHSYSPLSNLLSVGVLLGWISNTDYLSCTNNKQQILTTEDKYTFTHQGHVLRLARTSASDIFGFFPSLFGADGCVCDEAEVEGGGVSGGETQEGGHGYELRGESRGKRVEREESQEGGESRGRRVKREESQEGGESRGRRVKREESQEGGESRGRRVKREESQEGGESRGRRVKREESQEGGESRGRRVKRE